MRMTSEVIDFCKKNSLFSGNDVLICGVSGGADSMALLHLFHTCGKEAGVERVICVHLNHGLRGEESDADERFVKDFCLDHGIQFISENAHMADIELPAGMGTEEYGRKARYDLYEKAAAMTGATRIATGHTMNDDAETVLFRLARGTGLKGAAGIPVRRGMYVRPLLCVTRMQTEQYCRENGINFREDSTNAEDDYARNRIRHHAIPALETVNVRTVEALSGFAEDAGEADSYLSARAEELLEKAERDGRYDAALLRSADRVIKRYALVRLLEKEGLSPDRDTVLRCLDVLDSTGRLMLAPRLQFVCRKDGCYFDVPDSSADEETALDGLSAFLPSGRGVELVPVDAADVISKKFTKALFNSTLDYDKVDGAVVLRHRRPGDRFSSARRRCTKPLKDIFSEKKLSNAEKARILLLCDSRGVIWLEGEGISSRVRPDSRTERAFAVTVKEQERTEEGELSHDV